MDPLQIYVTPLMSPIKRWLGPLTVLLALLSVFIGGKSVLFGNALAAVNAWCVANYFKSRLKGETASYLYREYEPDHDEIVLVDWVMVVAALLTVLAPIYLIVDRST